jgi:hypothetical protein
MGRCLASDEIAWHGVWAVLQTKQFSLGKVEVREKDEGYRKQVIQALRGELTGRPHGDAALLRGRGRLSACGVGYRKGTINILPD